jgi:hypothetical protein
VQPTILLRPISSERLNQTTFSIFPRFQFCDERQSPFRSGTAHLQAPHFGQKTHRQGSRWQAIGADDVAKRLDQIAVRIV